MPYAVPPASVQPHHAAFGGASAGPAGAFHAPGSFRLEPEPPGEADDVRLRLHELVWAVSQLDGELRCGLDGPVATLPPASHAAEHGDRRIGLAEIVCTSSMTSPAPDVMRVGVGQALEWTLGSIRNDLQMARRLVRKASETPPSGTSGQPDRRCSLPSLPHSIEPPPPPAAARPLDVSARRRSEEGWGHPGQWSSFDDSTPPASTSMATSAGPKPLRSLGPPTPVGFSSPPSQSFSSAQTAHLQDLQHQVSTKTLALQTLQKEQEKLLSAYSRSQTRCGALEKKFKVSDVEINKLTEERMTLQAQIEALETEAEALTRSRDEARSQSVTNGSQYLKIMSMASALEAKTSSDKKRWTAERDEWARTKAELEDRIKRSERERSRLERSIQTIGDLTIDEPDALHPSSTTYNSSVGEAKPLRESEADHHIDDHHHHHHHHDADDDDDDADDAVLRSDSTDVLRAEIVRLRKGCRAVEAALQDLRDDGRRVEQVMQKFGGIGRRVASKAEQACRLLGPRPSGAGVAEGDGDGDGNGDGRGKGKGTGDGETVRKEEEGGETVRKEEEGEKEKAAGVVNECVRGPGSCQLVTDGRCSPGRSPDPHPHPPSSPPPHPPSFLPPPPLPSPSSH